MIAIPRKCRADARTTASTAILTKGEIQVQETELAALANFTHAEGSAATHGYGQKTRAKSTIANTQAAEAKAKPEH